MATIKSYTDLEQSRRLAKILPPASADMHYNNASIKGINYVDEYRAELMDYNTAQKVLSNYLINPMFGIIPCWSLAALLDVLPTKLQIVLAINDFQGDRKEKYVIGSVEHDRYDCCADNPVDACVAMIEKLHELNLL